MTNEPSIPELERAIRPLLLFSQEVEIDTWFVIQAFGKRLGREIYEIVIALEIIVQAERG